MSAQFRDGHFTVPDGLRLHFREYPGPLDGPPLLCLPGLTRNVRDFDSFASRMSPLRRVIALEFRGRGESDWDPVPGRYLPPTYARDSIALLDHLGVAEAVFVGTSLGGIVTMVASAFADERIAAAILNDVGPELSEAGLDRIRGYVGSGKSFASWDEAASAVASNQGHLPAEWGDDQWQAMAQRVCRVDEGGTIRFDYDPAIAEPFRQATARTDSNMWPLFDKLAQKPVLVVRGERSELFLAGALEALATRSANVATVTVPGAGHAPELDEPEALEAIDAFLRRVEAQRS